MKRSRFTEEQITLALRQAEAGTPVVEIYRKLQVTEQTFYRWKRMYGSLGTAEIRELLRLRDENKKLKQLVADLTLDKHILQESLKKSSETCGEADVDQLGVRRPESLQRGYAALEHWLRTHARCAQRLRAQRSQPARHLGSDQGRLSLIQRVPRSRSVARAGSHRHRSIVNRLSPFPR